MTDPKIPPELAYMPPHIREKIVSFADFRSKLCLNRTHFWYRDYIKKETVQYRHVGISRNDGCYFLRVGAMENEDTLFEYYDHEGGCMLKSEGHEKVVTDRTSTDAIVSDLSVILLNPRVFIEDLAVYNLSENEEEEEKMEDLIDEIEALLTSRTEQLPVKHLTLQIDDSSDNAPKILLHVVPGVLEFLYCGSDYEELDLEEFAGYEQVKQLRELAGSWRYGPLECWKHVVYFQAYELFLEFEAIPAVIEAALAHGDRFKEYQISTEIKEQGDLWTILARFFNFYGPGEEDRREETRYIKTRNETDFLVLKWSGTDGNLSIERRHQNQIWTDPIPPEEPSVIVTETHIIHQPTAIHPYRTPNYIPTYLQPSLATSSPTQPIEQKNQDSMAPIIPSNQ